MDKISALMDSELEERQVQEQVLRLNRDPELSEHWRTFHLIGDALRGERALSTDFERRIAARLSAEPTVLAPRSAPARRMVTYALSAAASLSAVALVGWMAFNNPLAPRTEGARAPAKPAAPAVAAAPVQPASIPSDGRMNEYLLAHQGFSPSTSIQGVAPYIRSVSSTHQAAGR